MPLTHYVIVRRDLPLGIVLAMVAHAAGESFYALSQGSSKVEHRTASPEVGGSSPPPGFHPNETIAVVLGARNEGRLTKLSRELAAASVPFVDIHETDGDYAGQLMAIGIVPSDKSVVATFVRDFHMLKELESCASS